MITNNNTTNSESQKRALRSVSPKEHSNIFLHAATDDKPASVCILALSMLAIAKLTKEVEEISVMAKTPYVRRVATTLFHHLQFPKTA